jgi:thiamine kinase-like enzyme
LSPDNLIYTHKNQVIFIDYEWARLNNKYWDIANFIREVDLPIKWIKVLCNLLKIKHLKKLLIFVYLATNYAYQWTFNIPSTIKIKKYQQITYRKLQKYYKYVRS